MGSKPKKDGTLKIPYKDFNLAIGGGLSWMKWLKKGQGKVYIS